MELYRVLLVDDEEDIREGISRKMDWLGLGFSLVGEAANGQDALELAESLRPDVILTDIKMPFMDGLELCRILTDRLPAARFVVFSGFDAFEYAKQAVTYQAFDYLLKPIDADELAETLIRLSGQIAREQRLVDHVQKIEKQSDRGKRLLRERFLRRLVFGRMHMTQQQLTEQMRRLEISLEPRNLAGADRHRGRTFSLYARCRCEPPLPGLWPAGNGDAGGDGRAGREVLSFR